MKRVILCGAMLLSLTAASTSWSAPTQSETPKDSVAIATERRVFELESQVRSLRSDLEAQRNARDVSSQSFGHQLTIFGFTLAIVLAASYFGVYLRVRLLVERQGRKIWKTTKEGLATWEKEFRESLDTRFSEETARLDGEFRGLEAEIYRAYAQMHADTPVVCWIWCLRAAEKFDDHEFIGAMIDNAVDALRKVTPNLRYRITDVLVEAQGIVAKLDETQYGVQKKIVLSELERIYKGDEGSAAT